VSGFDPASFPVRARGRLFEDFTEGQTFDHHWGRTIGEADNTLFCAAMCQWTPLYLNREYARSQGHPDLVISPMLVLCTVVGLSVEDLSEAGGPFLEVRDCRFGVPVYPGDTLTARSAVLGARLSASRPGSGIVTWSTTGLNQRGEVVVELVRANLVTRRTNIS